MQPKEYFYLQQLEQLIFTQPRSKDNPGQKIHNLANFSLQRQLWDIVLSSSNSSLVERIQHLLPKSAVVEQSHSDLYQTYDCVSFALYVLSQNFLTNIVSTNFQGIIVPQPEVRSLGWKEKSYWKTRELESFEFKKVSSPDENIPTLVILTQEDKHLVYTRPVHFAVCLSCFNGKRYIAHKPNTAYLPEIIRLDQVIDVYSGEPNSLNAVPGIEYWEFAN